MDAGLRDAPCKATVLFTVTGNRQLVAACCEHAARRGVRPGMTLAHARALAADEEGDGLNVQPYELRRDEAALYALAVWAGRFSPIVSVDPPSGLLLDVTGCDHLFGGEPALVHRFTATAQRLGFRVRAAVASTIGCAWAMARYGPRQSDGCVAPGSERVALADLPVESLRIDVETVETLREVAVDRVGQLLELRRDDLATRYGDDLLMRIDQALGQAMEAMDPVRPVTPLSVERVFDGPTCQLEAILITVLQLVESLTGDLRRRESGVARLALTLDRIDAAPIRHTLTMSHPTRDHRHLWALLKPRVETSNLGHGVERVEVRAVAARRIAHDQARRWGGDAEAEADREQSLGRFVDMLAERFDTRGALQAELVESHIPERAARLRPYASNPAPSSSLRRSAASSLPPRPPLVWPRPEPLEVLALAPDGPPSWLKWRGDAAAVVTSYGPERIAWEWWRDEARTSRLYGARDYYTIHDEHGRWLWVYRHLPTNTWFVHGQWS